VGVSEDIDGDTRAMAPYIGADEVMAPSSAVASIEGRIITAEGRGAGGAWVALYRSAVGIIYLTGESSGER
jgi:hypothetical protein